MSASNSLERVLEDLAFIDDRLERLQYMMELGRDLDPLSEAEHCDANRVQGCMSNVWLVAEADPQDEARLRFRVDSDAEFIKGLAGLLLLIFNGHTPREILEIQIEPLIAHLKLGEVVTSQRRNGLHGMIARIRGHAQAAWVAQRET